MQGSPVATCDRPARPTPAPAIRAASGRKSRLLAGAAAIVCAAVLTTAVALRPDFRGYGTHQALGLSPCSTLQTTGWPCPTCGMTTAFAHTVRGQFVAAVKAQAFGTILAVLTAVGLIVATLHALTGRPSAKTIRPRWWWLWTLLGGTAAGWGIKLTVGWMTGTLPIH
jgi:hypothetical protein